MTTPWILISTLLMSDGSNYIITDYQYVRKQYCLMGAKNEWVNYYNSQYYGKAILTSICHEKKNPYNFVQVVCDRNGGCNI